MTDIVNVGQPAQVLNKEAMPANVDLVIYKGDKVDINVTIQDSDGTPLSLTGLTPTAQLRENYDSVTSVNFDCSIVGSEVRIYMSSPTTAGLASGSYIWDFQLTDGDGDSRTYFTGDVTVSREVTRP